MCKSQLAVIVILNDPNWGWEAFEEAAEYKRSVHVMDEPAALGDALEAFRGQPRRAI